MAGLNYAQGDYILAVQRHEAVCGNYTGFVYDYSADRIEQIKQIMYEPMLEEGEHMLERYRYYSAEHHGVCGGYRFRQDKSARCRCHKSA